MLSQQQPQYLTLIDDLQLHKDTSQYFIYLMYSISNASASVNSVESDQTASSSGLLSTVLLKWMCIT